MFLTPEFSKPSSSNVSVEAGGRAGSGELQVKTHTPGHTQVGFQQEAPSCRQGWSSGPRRSLSETVSVVDVSSEEGSPEVEGHVLPCTFSMRARDPEDRRSHIRTRKAMKNCLELQS